MSTAAQEGIVVQRDSGTTGQVPNHRHCQSTICSAFGHDDNGITSQVISEFTGQESNNLPEGWIEYFRGNTQTRNNITYDIKALLQILNAAVGQINVQLGNISAAAGQQYPLRQHADYASMNLPNLGNGWKTQFDDNNTSADDIKDTLTIVNSKLGEILARLDIIDRNNITDWNGLQGLSGAIGVLKSKIEYISQFLDGIDGFDSTGWSGIQTRISSLRESIESLQRRLGSLETSLNARIAELDSRLSPQVTGLPTRTGELEEILEKLSGKTLSWMKDHLDEGNGETNGDLIDRVARLEELVAQLVESGTVSQTEYWTVTFDATEGKFDDVPYRTTTVKIEKGNTFQQDEKTAPDCSRSGYVFDGWKTGSNELFDVNTQITGDITYYAQWKLDGKILCEDGDDLVTEEGDNILLESWPNLN